MSERAGSGTRRTFLRLVSGAGLTHLLPPAGTARASAGGVIEAIAFDAFAIFDPRSIVLVAEEVYPGRGAELSNVWRARQFEYAWLRAVSKRYADFWQVTEDALVFAAKDLKLELTSEKRSRLMGAYLRLRPWPGATEGLRSLRLAGFRLALLSNFTPAMLFGCIKASALENVFEHQLSTDRVKTYKPDPLAYAMAVDAFLLPLEKILFVAFGGWDAAGAKSFGYRTYWFNPGNQPAEELGERPDAIGASFADLINFLHR